jgi:DNA-binding transcriptional LysR family regulator
MVKHQQLLHALALNEHGNFHRAADSVKISQPAFSRSNRSLEDNLDVPLFERNAHKVTLTPYGEVLMRRAKTIVAEAEELKREMSLLKGADVGELSVAMGVYAAENSGTKIVSRLARDHPKLNLRICERHWRNVAEQVLDRSVDLGYANTDAIDSDRLEIEQTASYEPVFFCRHGHPLLDQGTLSAKDLRNHPAANFRRTSEMESKFKGHTKFSRQAEVFTPSIEFENMAMARAVVAESDTICLATPLQIERWLRSGEFKILPYPASRFTLNYGFITLRDRFLSPATQAFMTQARDIEADLMARNSQLLKEYASVK